MIEVYKNIFISGDEYCFYEDRENWAVIHACKDPCHKIGVGYRGNLSSLHPNYLIKEKENHLYLNIVDMVKPLSPKFINPIIKKALDFIEGNINHKQILIHCNLGESRSPSIALVYLAKKNIINSSSFVDAIEDFKKIYPNYNPGNGIYSYLNNNWTDVIN